MGGGPTTSGGGRWAKIYHSKGGVLWGGRETQRASYAQPAQRGEPIEKREGAGTLDGTALHYEFYTTIWDARLGSGPRPTAATTWTVVLCVRAISQHSERKYHTRDETTTPPISLPPLSTLSRQRKKNFFFPLSLSTHLYIRNIYLHLLTRLS